MMWQVVAAYVLWIFIIALLPEGVTAHSRKLLFRKFSLFSLDKGLLQGFYGASRCHSHGESPVEI